MFSARKTAPNIDRISTGNLPENTFGKWNKVVEIGLLPPSADGKYTFSICASKVAPGAELEGAEIIPEAGCEFRNPPEYLGIRRFEVVTRKIVFRAKAPEVKFTLRDWKNDREPGAPVGDRRLVNFIGVSAYFAE